MRDHRTVLAVKISAPNDTFGNPRRGWIIGGEILPDGGYLSFPHDRFVDERYAGERALTEAWPNARVVAHVDVPAREYTSRKRDV